MCDRQLGRFNSGDFKHLLAKLEVFLRLAALPRTLSQMKIRYALFGILCFAFTAFAAEDAHPLRVFIHASKKTHGPGAHDYPRFLEEWKKLLNEHGAVADGALHPPTEGDFAKSDVVIMYASDGTNMTAEDRSHLEAFLMRGGGLVVLHDSICGTNTAWFASLAGGAKQHGEMNWKTGHTKIHYENHSHPIVQGFKDFEMDDEIFFHLQTIPEMKVLATAARSETEIVPQLWVLEKTLPQGKPYRAVVSLQGHLFVSFSLPEYRKLLLRSIAWAGKRRVDLLTGEASNR